jgi:hypothetical protein
MESSSAVTFNQLSSFDWSMRLAMSSDKISGIRKPLLMLKLEVMQPDGSTKEKLVELDNAELGSLLKTLKQAQKLTHS